MIYQVFVPYSVQMGHDWPARAPVRRAIIPAKRSNNADRSNTFSSSVEPVGLGKSSSNGVDDRIHNALLEELCADFGVTDSSYVDFLNFDIPTDRVQSGQLPADLEELAEIVTFGAAKPKIETASSVSESVRRAGSLSSHVSFLRPGVTTIQATSGMQMNIPDDVASPTISSSCEESKAVEGGGEGLSDFPPTVHSTTGCTSAKPDTDTSNNSEDSLKRPSIKNESVVKRKQKEVIPPSTQLLGEQDSSAVSPSKDQSERSDSTTSSPRPVTKKARIIESGEDLLKDVKKSYAFVCGADIFSPPTRPVVSHPRLQTPFGSPNRKNELVSYPQNATGIRMSFTDGYESPFRYDLQNRSVGQQSASDKSYGTSSSQAANFDNLTPGKGFSQHYYNEWHNSPTTVFDRSYRRTNVMHRTHMTGSATGDFQPRGAQYQGSVTGTSSDIRGSVPYTDAVPYPRTVDLPSPVDQSGLNYQSVNRTSCLAVNQSGRSYGFSVGPYGGSYQHVGRQTVPQQNDFYCNPSASPYRSLPSHASNAVGHGTVNADEGGNVYPAAYRYPAQHTHSANMNANANYSEQGDHSSAASPVRYRGQSVTPGFPSAYPFQPGMENYMRDSNTGNPRYASGDSGRASLTMESRLQQRASMAPGVKKNGDFNSVPTQNECTFSRTNAGSNPYAERRESFPVSPILDCSAVNQMTPRGGSVPSYAEQSYAASSSLAAGRAAENGCHSFMRHLIGSGSGPYRSHPLFPLLRDLVIADMNFEAPSFPYPLIAGLPKSFDRLISNYFSCTAHSANSASVDSSVDTIVMDALRYAHSALLGTFDDILLCLYVSR